MVKSLLSIYISLRLSLTKPCYWIERAISTNCRRLANAAVKALHKDFARCGLERQDELLDHVLDLLGLGDPEDFTTMKRRFIWELSYSFEATTAKEVRDSLYSTSFLLIIVYRDSTMDTWLPTRSISTSYLWRP